MTIFKLEKRVKNSEDDMYLRLADAVTALPQNGTGTGTILTSIKARNPIHHFSVDWMNCD